MLVLIAWVAAMAALVNRSYLQASSTRLATDLARYGSGAGHADFANGLAQL